MLAQGHEFFCRGRVNRDRVVEVSFGRAHFDGDCEALNHFICCAPNNVTPNHFFILTRNNKFYRCGHSFFGDGIIHISKSALIDLNIFVPEFSSSLFFAKSDCTDGGVRKYHRWDRFIVEFGIRLIAKQSIGQASGCGNGNWRQGGSAGDIADCINIGNSGLLPFVSENKS